LRRTQSARSPCGPVSLRPFGVRSSTIGRQRCRPSTIPRRRAHNWKPATPHSMVVIDLALRGERDVVVVVEIAAVGRHPGEARPIGLCRPRSPRAAHAKRRLRSRLGLVVPEKAGTRPSMDPAFARVANRGKRCSQREQ
jgi:hypothetical protein